MNNITEGALSWWFPYKRVRDLDDETVRKWTISFCGPARLLLDGPKTCHFRILNIDLRGPNSEPETRFGAILKDLMCLNCIHGRLLTQKRIVETHCGRNIGLGDVSATMRLKHAFLRPRFAILPSTGANAFTIDLE